jgi:hypothetical protein
MQSIPDEKTVLSGVVIEPATVNGGAPPQPLGTVTLASRAPAGGVEIALASNRPEIAQVPSSVRVPEGAEATFFHVTVRPTTDPATVLISASREGESRSATLQVHPLGAVGVVAAPTSNGSTAPPASSTEQVSQATHASSSVGSSIQQATPLLPTPNSFRAALLIVAPAVPLLATVFAVGIYVIPQGEVLAPLVAWVKPNSLLTAAGVALILGVVFAALTCWVAGSTSADRANSAAFGQLVSRFREIEARLAVVLDRTDMSDSERVASAQAASFTQLIRTELGTPGARWLLGTGYVNLWNLVHRAEQALILVEPVEDVVRVAIYDDLRLQGSQIDNSADLLVKLRLAIGRLQPEATGYFAQQPGVKPADTTAADQSPATLATARAALAQVHQSIDGFRDSAWDAMARTRNHLLGTIGATGAGTFLLLALALAVSPIAPSAPFSDAIVAAAAFYLVGAMVGLFNRLYKDSANDNSVEDYGLTSTRLALTPILSGLAALGGVLVVAMLPAVMSSGVFMVSSGAAAGAQRLATAIPTLADIYSLQGNAFGVIFAAIFGLTPALLLGSLQDAADKYRDSIKSTAPANPAH